MSLSPYTKSLIAAGATHTGVTEVFTVVTRDRRGLIVAHDVSAAAGAFSATLLVEGVDEESAARWTLLQGAAQTTVSTKILQVHPQMVAVTNLVAASQLPARIRITLTYGDATQVTHSLAYQLTG